MADNKYRGYLENENEDSSYAGGALKFAGVVGGGALAFRYRRNIGSAASQGMSLGTAGAISTIKLLNRATGANKRLEGIGKTLRALDHAVDQRSPLSHFLNPKRFNRRFDDEYTRQAQLGHEMGRRPLGGVQNKLEKDFDEYLSNRNMRETVVSSALRFDAVVKELKTKMPTLMDNGLEQILVNKKKDDFFSSPNQLKIEGLIEQYSKSNAEKKGYRNVLEFASKTEKEKFVKDMFETLQKYSNYGKGKNGEKLVRTQIQGMRKLEYETLKKNNKKQDTFFTRMMEGAGYQQLTAKQASDAGLLDPSAVRSPKKDGPHRGAGFDEKFKTMMRLDKEFEDLVLDPNLWVDKKGNLLDMRKAASTVDSAVTGFREGFQIPFLRFNPLDLLHLTSIEAARNAPKSYFLRRGTIDPLSSDKTRTLEHPITGNESAAVGQLARDYMYTGGNIYDVASGKLIKKDTYLVSARFGAMPRITSSMANLSSKGEDKRGFLKKLFDIGHQETESIPSRVKSIFTKFNDPDWEPNTVELLSSGRLRTSDEIEGAYKNIYAMLEQRTTMLSDDTVEYLNKHVQQAFGNTHIDLTKMRTEEEVMTTLGRIVDTPISENKGGHGEVKELMQQMWSQYRSNPQKFLNNKRLLSDNAIYVPEPISVLDNHEAHLVSKIDDVRRLIHLGAMQQVEISGRNKVTVGSLIQDGIKSGDLDENALQEVRNLHTLGEMRQWWDDIYNGSPDNKDNALMDFARHVTTDPSTGTKGQLQHALRETANDMNPTLSMGPGQKPPQPFGYVGYQTMNKAKGYQWGLENYNQLLSEGVNPLKAGTKTALEILGQPFAGRGDLSKVNTFTAASYYLAERMDNALAKLGFGLSQQNRGSMQSILFNQFGRRIVLPYMAYEQLKWADGMLGDAPSDALADTYVNMHEDVGFFKEITGLNKIGGQWSRVFAGGEQAGEWAPVKAFNFATFGAFSDYRSGEEIRDYYESGEDPIRKGRYWGIGSSTPWQGGKIDRYEPNWYRKIKSDYKFTDTLYGSEGEYWANHWMPTLTNPLAPLKHFVLDPNHWEEKHRESRPYPISGGLNSLEQIPAVGPILNNTIGRVLSPRTEHPNLEKEHRRYLEEINASIAAQYDGAGQGGSVEFMPAGGYRAGTSDAVGGNASAAIGSGAGASGASGDARAQLAAINLGITQGGGSSQSVSSLQSLRDPDVVANLYDIGTMHSVSGTTRDAFYSISELAGMYGFLTKTGIGFDESGREMTLEPSSRITSYARAWWDLELGGLGGTFSEIGRRYIPRDPNKNYWNPIRNTMPDWMPGVDYFTDFKHGDPYVKIKNGEMRLPGEAYETLYKLHPDEFGEYGAFDRFRILADVAPYSKEYKFYRRVVSAMNQKGMLTEDMKDEYAEIRDQTTERKKKYNFYNRRFGNMELLKDEVTITHMLDSTTFLTKEYPNNPIKMAAVSIKSDDTETQQWLGQYLYEGAKVNIELDADPLHRVRDDTMQTMRAVVYANKNEEGMPFYMTNKGQNLNFMLANRSFGGFLGFGGDNKVSVNDDGSATSTGALFSKDMVTVGKMWEFVSHDVLSNIPIVSTIADKYLPVKSPVEMYKDLQVYGKEWRPWNEPIKSWLVPMFEKMAAEHPMMAAAQGYGMGWAFGKPGKGKFYGKWIGAITAGSLATMRVFDEAINGVTPGGDDTWIPERRKKEREINEYFDKLKYVKYKGLYEKARQEAIDKEGVDVQSLIDKYAENGEKNKRSRRFLEAQKKWLSIGDKLGYVDGEGIREKLEEVRQELKEIDEDRSISRLGPISMLALKYHAEYTSTLHGADPHGDMTKIFKALPSKDREFFTEFMKAAPDEREEILRLVPKNQRRFYQAQWGLDVDRQQSLDRYFDNHYLPGENWEGWEVGTSLDNIKVKVVRNEGLELTEFGLWGDDEQRADAAGARAVDMNSVGSLIDTARLHRVLRGAGLDDINITMTTAKSNENLMQVGMDIVKDRTGELIQEINDNMGSIF